MSRSEQKNIRVEEWSKVGESGSRKHSSMFFFARLSNKWRLNQRKNKRQKERQTDRKTRRKKERMISKLLANNFFSNVFKLSFKFRREWLTYFLWFFSLEIYLELELKFKNLKLHFLKCLHVLKTNYLHYRD